MKTKTKVLAIIVLSMLLLSACASARNAKSTVDSYSMGAPAGIEVAPQPAVAPEAPMAEGSRSLDASKVAAGELVHDRLVIKNGNISIIVVDPARSMDAIARMADGMGGWVVSSNLYKTQTADGVEIPQANITIRVPVDKLNEALIKIKSRS